MPQPFDYPETRRDDTVDSLHGRDIADPYRWLEDADSVETADWVSRQNAVTDAHLSGLRDREWFQKTMSAIVHRPRAGVPSKHGGKYFVSRNDGQQAQDVWYVADTLPELLAGGRMILDPNSWSADGTDSLSTFTVSHDGHYLAYAVSEGGSDWQIFKLVDLETGEPIDDVRIQTKFSEPSWLGDHQSYLYSAFDHDDDADGTQTTALGAPQLKLHRVGDPLSADQVILEFPENDRLMFWPIISHDRQLIAVPIVQGTENRNRLWFYRVQAVDGVSALSEPIKIIDEPTGEFSFIRAVGDVVFLSTDLDAPLGRVVSVDLGAFERTGVVEFTEVIPQGEATLLATAAAGNELIMVALDDARPVVSRFALDGSPLGALDIDGGSLVGLACEAEDNEGFIGMSSVTSQTESYAFAADTGTVRRLDELVPSGGDFVAPEVTVERRKATSKDGTQVPYFLISRADLDNSAPRPTFLYGYGGFKIPVLADYRPGWSGWLAAGGVLVIVNLRGGGEYGTAWYDDGRLTKKQNVFDDFIAVGEQLKESGVTTTEQLTLHGRSNGGLLVGATMTQRPDLAAVAIPGVGVLDVLRFHKFTIGAAWTSDFGNPDVAEDFEVAHAYSPLHNVAAGAYPATLVLTGDHDDRVVPLHSHKFTATLQHAQAGEQPVLTRIEVATGHGMGKPTAMVAAEWADLLAFAAHHTGLKPVV